MAVILVGVQTTKALIFIKVRAGRHKQGRVAQLVLNKHLDSYKLKALIVGFFID
jgi:hypothetical protein